MSRYILTFVYLDMPKRLWFWAVACKPDYLAKLDACRPIFGLTQLVTAYWIAETFLHQRWHESRCFVLIYILFCDACPCYHHVKRKGPDDIYLIRFYMINLVVYLHLKASCPSKFFVLMLYATTWMSASKKTGIRNAWFACMHRISLYFCVCTGFPYNFWTV